MATTTFQTHPLFRRFRRKSPRFDVRVEHSGICSGRRSFRIAKPFSYKEKKKKRPNYFIRYTCFDTTNEKAKGQSNQQPKLLNQSENIHTHASHQQTNPRTPRRNNAAYNENEKSSPQNTLSSSPSPEIPSLFQLTGKPPTRAPSPDPPADSHRCTNLIPQPSNNQNPFYKRPQPGSPTIGPHPTIPLLAGGSQIFLLNKSQPFPAYPPTAPTSRCTNRLGQIFSDPNHPHRPLRLVPCMAPQILLAAPFRIVIPACPAMICIPCSTVNKHNFGMIKEACALGICSTCYRRESSRRANLTPAEQETVKSRHCVCMTYPDQNLAICATHIERYALEVQNRAQLCIDYRRQLCHSEAAKKKDPYAKKRAQPRKKHVGTYWRHHDPPAGGLAPWPPTAAHPRNEQGWWDVPRCPCGRMAGHTRKGWPETRKDKVRSCAICMPIPGDSPLDIANPRPMTVASNAAGYHVGPGVKAPPKEFQNGPHTGRPYGTEGWVRRG